MWSNLSEPWKVAFEQAWEAYCHGSVPVGAALTDETGAVVARGRSMQFEKSDEPGRISWSKLSHAEVNTLLQVSAHDHQNIRAFTLYTTLEPCPLCIGAFVMSNVRNLRFAARDGCAGSVSLLQASEFISGKHIAVYGPESSLEIPSVVLHTCFLLESGRLRNDAIMQAFERDCPEGVRLAVQWHDTGKLKEAQKLRRDISSVWDELVLSIPGD